MARVKNVLVDLKHYKSYFYKEPQKKEYKKSLQEVKESIDLLTSYAFTDVTFNTANKNKLIVDCSRLLSKDKRVFLLTLYIPEINDYVQRSERHKLQFQRKIQDVLTILREKMRKVNEHERDIYVSDGCLHMIFDRESRAREVMSFISILQDRKSFPFPNRPKYCEVTKISKKPNKNLYNAMRTNIKAVVTNQEK